MTIFDGTTGRRSSEESVLLPFKKESISFLKASFASNKLIPENEKKKVPGILAAAEAVLRSRLDNAGSGSNASTGYTKPSNNALIDNHESSNDTLKDIIESDIIILHDEEFTSKIYSLLDSADFHEKAAGDDVDSADFDENSAGIDAVSATVAALDSYIDLFENSNEELLRERADDLRDLQEIILNPCAPQNTELKPGIYYAKTFSAGDILSFPKGVLKGIVCTDNAVNSHGIILAKSMGIPTATGADAKLCAENEGKIAKIVSPEFTFPLKDENHPLYANIFTPSDLTEEICSYFDGVGLFRSEGLFLERTSEPDFEAQFSAYTRVLSLFKGRPVTIRTLDVDSDKFPEYLGSFTGKRGLAYTLEHPNLFTTQLKALAAAATPDLRILLPVVENPENLKEYKQLFTRISDRKIPTGIMIETVKAVKNIDFLLPDADFVSIGSNDLTLDLYGLSGRESIPEDLSLLLETIAEITQKAHTRNLSVCLCGELAADSKFRSELFRLGVDSLSVAP